VTVALRAGRRRVLVSHPDRVLFPEGGYTKLDLARYYAAVGEAMLPHVRGRPLALQSYPQGIGGKGFFRKNVPGHLPGWIATARVPRREGGAIRQVIANRVATLVYLAGQNVITPHIWTSRCDRLEQPDRIVFDLDPSVERFAEVRAAARTLGDLLRELGLMPFVMTSGSRGLHVVVALRRGARYEEVHAFAGAVAAALVATDPRHLTVEFRRQRRGERIFVDVGRNAYAQHAVAPYGVRALPGAPVAAPLRWEELDDPRLGPRTFTLASMPERLAAHGDPWREIARHAHALARPARELGRIAGD
jgi:bifunctional non-homologous end joining protein LigD